MIEKVDNKIDKYINVGKYILGLTNTDTQYIIYYNQDLKDYKVKEIDGGPFDTNNTSGIDNSNKVKTPGIFSYTDKFRYYYINPSTLKFEEQELNPSLFPYVNTKPEYFKFSNIDSDNNSDILLMDESQNLLLNFGPDFDAEIKLDILNQDFQDTNVELLIFQESKSGNFDLNAYKDGEYKDFETTGNTVNATLSIIKENNNKKR